MRHTTQLVGFLSFVAISGCLVQALESANETQLWWQGPFSMFQTNLRDIDTDMDTEATAEYILQHGSQAWLQSVGGIISNYPSKFDFHTSNPMLSERESGDLVKDTIESAHARGIRVLARMDFSKVHYPVAQAHPNWTYISPNGSLQTHTRNLVSVCPSGEWYQERIFDILDEVMENYDIDGFFVNYAGYNENDYFRHYHGVCHCDSCKRRWAEYSEGKKLPDGKEDDNYAEWKLFSDGMIDKWTVRVKEFIKERLPEAGLILGGAADLMFYEANNAIDREIWHHATSETVSKFLSWRPEVPVLVNCASFNDHAYRISSEQAEHYEQFHLQAMAHGANPSTYIIGTPDKIPWAGLPKAGELMRFHKKWRDVYTGMRPLAKIGLLLPREQQMSSPEQFAGAMTEYKGLYKAMQELHVPFGVIAQQYLANMIDNGEIDTFNIIVVPNFGKIDDGLAKGLDDFVSRGGTLVATGHVGADEGGKLQLRSLPAKRREAYLDELEKFWSTYMVPEQKTNRTGESIYEAPIIPILGSYSLYKWKDESRGMYRKLTNGSFAPPEYIYGNVETEERGVGIGSYKKGTGVLVPFPVGLGYRDMGLSVYRDFFELILKEVSETPLLSFDLAPQVEVTLYSNAAGQTVVHLINHSGIRYQNYGRHLPIPASQIIINRGSEGVMAKALKSNTTLDIVGGKIQVPGLDLFDVVVIEGLSV